MRYYFQSRYRNWTSQCDTTNFFSWKLRRSVRINGKFRFYLLMQNAEKIIGAEVDNFTFKARKLMKIVSIGRHSRFYARKLRKILTVN